MHSTQSKHSGASLEESAGQGGGGMKCSENGGNLETVWRGGELRSFSSYEVHFDIYFGDAIEATFAMAWSRRINR